MVHVVARFLAQSGQEEALGRVLAQLVAADAPRNGMSPV